MEGYPSIAVENFIKAIFKYEIQDGLDAKSGTIANELGITHAAATDMARKLASKNMIEYEKYKELKLTPSGKKLAVHIVRKHRLWETFLHQVLGLSMHEIHKEAELLEHATSDFLLDKISEYLGNPSFDPHGDPIPNKEGKIDDSLVNLSLVSANLETTYKICRLRSSDEEFFDFCMAHNIVLGVDIKVKRQYPKTQMLEIEIDNKTLLIHYDFANAINVE